MAAFLFPLRRHARNLAEVVGIDSSEKCKMRPLFYLYLLRCADGSLYCGIAGDLAKRVGEHNGAGGSKKGAKYTRSRRPVALAWSKKIKTKSAAMKAEAAMKKLSREEKLEIVARAKRSAGGEKSGPSRRGRR